MKTKIKKRYLECSICLVSGQRSDFRILCDDADGINIQIRCRRHDQNVMRLDLAKSPKWWPES